ncbi:MAG: imidazole glycerol phosphate synthase subunit HisF [Bacteroidia bacterium]|nr:imidazole glycerol phosphate synthase subunit HisF [Bacteroidia bacterium]
MLSKRIISCLDIKDGRTVKGVNFENIIDAGDPVELAIAYAQQGIDELVFLDITASNEKRKILVDLVSRISRQVNIPFTVGGGISSVEDVSVLLNSGADKVSINSAAVKDPGLLKKMAGQFGSQCIVVAIDTKFENNDWWVYINGGQINTGIKAVDWAKKITELGAGEILLTSMNNDGTKKGFAVNITKQISEAVNIPVIASGGAGTMQHFKEIFISGKADAALAASIFHYKEIEVLELKKYLKNNNLEIRI